MQVCIRRPSSGDGGSGGAPSRHTCSANKVCPDPSLRRSSSIIARISHRGLGAIIDAETAHAVDPPVEHDGQPVRDGTSGRLNAEGGSDSPLCGEQSPFGIESANQAGPEARGRTVASPWMEKLHAGAGEEMVLLQAGEPRRASAATSPPARFGSRVITSPDRVRVRMRLWGIGAARKGKDGSGCGGMEGHSEEGGTLRCTYRPEGLHMLAREGRDTGRWASVARATLLLRGLGLDGRTSDQWGLLGSRR